MGAFGTELQIWEGVWKSEFNNKGMLLASVLEPLTVWLPETMDMIKHLSPDPLHPKGTLLPSPPRVF